MLTDRERTLVRETWTQVLLVAPAASALFYERLFEIAPTLRALFRHTDMDAQGAKLVQVLGFAVAHLDRLDDLAPAVEALGRRHAGYGVRDQDYAAVGTALLWTLERGLGAAFTAEARAAWTTTFQLLAGIMRSAVAAGAALPATTPSSHQRGAARAITSLGAALLALGIAAHPAAARTIDTRSATAEVIVTTLRVGQTFTAVPRAAGTAGDPSRARAASPAAVTRARRLARCRVLRPTVR